MLMGYVDFDVFVGSHLIDNKFIIAVGSFGVPVSWIGGIG
jgi:hypothetical protein